MELLLPKYVLLWIDANKGELSRQQFIVNSLIKLREVQSGVEKSDNVDKWFDDIIKR